MTASERQLLDLLDNQESSGLSPSVDATALVQYLAGATVCDRRHIPRILESLGSGSRCVERLKISIHEEE